MLSPDAQALLLLCSRLGLPKDCQHTPLTLREWNPLAKRLAIHSLSPGDLTGMRVIDLQSIFNLPEHETNRLNRLLAREPVMSAAIEQLEGMDIHVLTRLDADYPARYHQRLREAAPVVLFYAGEAALLGQPGIAVVGSRHLDPIGQECAAFVGNACGLSGLVLYSGGAKGVDTISMNAALEARGTAVGILAENLERAIRLKDVQSAFQRGDLCLATPYAPDAGFSVGAAMGRNRLIYCLADYAIIVASDADKGGTWAGAREALKAGWLPVFVLEHAQMPEGNRRLLQNGGVALPHPFPQHYSKLMGWLEAHGHTDDPAGKQLGLF